MVLGSINHGIEIKSNLLETIIKHLTNGTVNYKTINSLEILSKFN